MNKTYIINKISELERSGFSRSEAIELLKVEAIDKLTNEFAWLNKCVGHVPSRIAGRDGAYVFRIAENVYTE